MLLCFAMLAGSTFAWFTDSVSNTGNKVQAGILDVQLLKDGEDISDSTEKVFDYICGSRVIPPALALR